MGISVGDLLSMDFFKDFHVIAGHKGLNREIQGVSFLEVPEGHRWSIGKELIFTSGYIFAEFEGYLDKFCENFIPSHAALVIKRGSYLDKIPEKLIEIYDRNSIPLITMPYSPSWMTVVNQVNVGVLNHAIQSLRIDISQGPGCYNQNYKEQAIQKILKTLETEMEFPAFLYDVTMDKHPHRVRRSGTGVFLCDGIPEIPGFLRRILHAHRLSDAPGNLRPAGGGPGCQQYRV